MVKVLGSICSAIFWIDAAAANGENVFNQFLLRPQAFIMGFASRGHPFIASTTFRTIQEELPEEEWVARLTNVSTRDAILTEVHTLLSEDTRFAKMFQGQWGNDKACAFTPLSTVACSCLCIMSDGADSVGKHSHRE